jgi:hypothetical protein
VTIWHNSFSKLFLKEGIIVTSTSIKKTGLLLCAMALAAASQAQVLFSDNFNADATGLGKTSLLNWNLTRDTVDVIGVGLFDIYPGNGNYVDMAGSGANPYGRISTATSITLSPGSYTLSFLLGKNSTGDRLMNISLGSAFSTTIADNLTYATLVPQSFTFSVGAATTANLVFDYPNDGINSFSQGYIIDDVVLQVATPAPEPLSLSLLALGGVCSLAHRRRRV